jgi:hypothetical protein
MNRRLIIGIAILAVLAIGGIAYASIPDSKGVIHGCYQKVNGQLRVIDTDAGGKCLASELPVNWSQSGPTGATGATGATGPTGQQGPPGPSPTLSVYEADGPFVTIPAGGVRGISADCSSTGDLATGGGFNVGSALVVIASIRNSNTTKSWLVIVSNPTNLDLQAQATVECLRSQ